MSFVSYAQNFEDVILWRVLKHIEKGFYIDVGANDPNIDSVTKAFYDRGWRGINIEPVGQWFEKLKDERIRDINLQLAAGFCAGELKIFEIPNTGLSTIDPEFAEKHRREHGFEVVEKIVPVKPLVEICNEYHVAPIHFLKVDVEGAESQVLSGMDFSVIRPWIVVIESTLPNSQVEDYKNWESLLTGSGYECVYFDGLNRFYVAEEHPELKEKFGLPPNCFDDFSFSGSQSFCQEVQRTVSDLQSALRTQELQAEALRQDFIAVTGDLERVTEGNKLQERELKAAQEHIGALNYSLEEQKKFSHNLQQTLEAANSILAEVQRVSAVELDEVKRVSEHWSNVADNLNRELSAVYRSRSWRVTWPLRVSGLLLRWVLRLPKRSVRWVLIKCMEFVIKRPLLCELCSRLVKKIPKFHQKLRQLALARGVIAVDNEVHQSQDAINISIPAHLTSHARRIYLDLAFAMNNGREGDS